MPWSSHSVQHSFQTLINELVDFHDQCGKQKNQNEFDGIRQACEAALDFLYIENLPKSADQMVASISTGIYQSLKTIGSKKSGREDNEEFILKLMNATRALSLFRNACEREIENNNEVQKQNKFEVMSNELEIIIPIRAAMTHLDTREELADKITSLGEVPLQSYSCFTFFKRVAGHYPLTMAGGGITGTIGLGYAGLTTLSHFVGPAFDALLHADQTGFTHQAVFAVSLLLTAGTLVSVAAVKTCVDSCEQDDKDEIEEGSSLLRRV